MTNTTPRRLGARVLIDRALAAGLDVTRDGPRVVLQRRGRGACTIFVYENGSLLRGDVDATVAARMTVAQAAKALGV
jgi:hypothetical protein